MARNASRARPGIARSLGGLALLAATLVAACGGAPSLPEVPDSFPKAALVTLASDSGGLHVELRSAPEPLVRGQNVGQLIVVDGNGQPIDGLTVTVLPWMPLDGHGTSRVGITDTGGGVFIANPLYLFMAGEWQLRMTFEGSFSDTATAIVEIP